MKHIHGLLMGLRCTKCIYISWILQAPRLDLLDVSVPVCVCVCIWEVPEISSWFDAARKMTANVHNSGIKCADPCHLAEHSSNNFDPMTELRHIHTESATHTNIHTYGVLTQWFAGSCDVRINTF